MNNKALILLAIIGLGAASITSLVVGSAFASERSFDGASEFSPGSEALREGIIGGKDILTKDEGASELSPGDDYKESLTKDEGASEFSPGREALDEGIIGPELKIK